MLPYEEKTMKKKIRSIAQILLLAAFVLAGTNAFADDLSCESKNPISRFFYGIGQCWQGFCKGTTEYVHGNARGMGKTLDGMAGVWEGGYHLAGAGKK